MTNILLNDVEAYGGLAAVDTYIASTSKSPNPEGYGGGHVIEDLIAGKRIHLRAWGPGTDCYVRKDINTYITIDDLNECYMFNPRNCYQNYNLATNTSDRTLHTYMGKLLPRMKNATYSSAGQLSPLLNDPHLDTIGVGTHLPRRGRGLCFMARNAVQYGDTREERRTRIRCKDIGVDR